MIEIRDFKGTILTTVDAYTLEGADLSGRDLTEARLPGAHLRRANLRGVTLSRADLRGAVLCDVDLSGGSLVYARLDGANLERANLAQVKADHAMFVRARVVEANLTGGSFVRANFDEAGYSDLTTPTPPNIRDSSGYATYYKKLPSSRTTRLGLWDRLFASKQRHLADAVHRGDLKRAQELLENGAKPDAPRESGGAGTMLHAAILHRDDQMLDLLVRHGANLEAPGGESFTPLQYAVQLGNGPAVLALLRAGADRTIISGGGRNLMELAYYYERKGLADLFAQLAGLQRIDLGS
jgi:hypothetical protein